MLCFAYHVYFVFIHENTSTEQEGKQKFMLLKQGTANIAVKTECEVTVNILCTLFKIV